MNFLPHRFFAFHACLTIFLLSLLMPAGTSRATTTGRGPSPEIALEDKMERVEIARLRIHNATGGLVEGSLDGGQTWRTVGRIEQPTVQVNRRGFTAARYVPSAAVAATAVNALHLKAGQNKAENRGIIWSLAPKVDDEAGRNSLQSEVAPGASAYTDMPGGSGIFGGPFTPFVGNPIFLDPERNNQPIPLPEDYVPKLNDTWLIRIERPRLYPRAIVFENRFGGLITIEYLGEKPRVIGQVLRPVLGVGRFVGSYFADVGRLRANHAGVIDISTSPRGLVGSFQIVPANHAMAPEATYIRELTQWMVVGPVSALDPSWEGIAPLYSAFLRPRHDPGDLWEENIAKDGVLGRFWFDVRRRDKKGKVSDWQPMPVLWMKHGTELPKEAGTALANVTHIRIFFPPGETVFNQIKPESTTIAEDSPTNEPTTEPAAQ